jgi:WYL domain
MGYDGPMSTSPILLEAIALKKCVFATYNRTEMKLAPHILYTKNDALYVDAVALTRNGVSPREKKIGAFHLSGLNDIRLADEHFQAEPLFDPTLGRYLGATLFAIER